ncbi:protochlorophyllide-dependent translocon component 52, chloroplastic-like isoform X2 [Cornus florida]|nr:protochlorophyllide-dependent translocon component 52, chloroplastic-like isoform X2 [Cornus florida]
MEALSASPLSSFQVTIFSPRLPKTQIGRRPFLNLPLSKKANSFLSPNPKEESKFKLFTAISPTVSTEFADPPEEEISIHNQDEKFDWFSQWYPIMPVCDLDKRVPHGKKVMGVDVVVWWDRNENAWKVFDDACPHRLAPLSEGRIDQWGRLQCVYHGWCFGGSGDCKFIPQAPPDGPPIHTFNKACAAVYPSTVQHDMVWFWPNTDPQYKDILMKKKPPYIPELDDPSYTKSMGNRDIPYGYEILAENLMDPAHVPYAHYGIMKVREPKNKVDREGGRPLEIGVEKLGINGFIAKQEMGDGIFIAPCVFKVSATLAKDQGNKSKSSHGTEEEPSSHVQQRSFHLIFICIPVSPGNSRLIWTFPRNFGVWIDQIVPRWIFHMGQNLILDSDLYLLHVEERRIMNIGPSNWQKACFVPTKSDALVVGFRKWLNKYAGGQVDWRTKFTGALPPSPPREQLMDR